MKQEQVEVSGSVVSLEIEKKWSKGTLFHHLTIESDEKSSLTLFNVFVPEKLVPSVNKNDNLSLGFTKAGGLWALYYTGVEKGVIEQAIYEVREAILEFRKEFPSSKLSGISSLQNLWPLLTIPTLLLSAFISLGFSRWMPAAFSFSMTFSFISLSFLLFSYFFLSYQGLWSGLPAVDDLKKRVEGRKKEWALKEKEISSHKAA